MSFDQLQLGIIFVSKGLSALDDNSSPLDDCVIVEDDLMWSWNYSPYTAWVGR